MSKIKVSVIIPTYKRSEDICRAVDSVLAQTIDSFEVIVVDDNGINTEDGKKTAEVMRKYENDERVHYIQHEHNKNGSAARNTGIGIAKGEYISFLDDDDAYLPERLEKMCKKMDVLDTSWGACYTGYVKHKPNGIDQYSGEKNEGDLFCQALMRSLYIGSGSNMFFRKSAVDKIGLFDEAFRRNQDLEYLARILKVYKMAYVDEVLMETFYDVRTTHMTIDESWEREQLFRKNFKSHLDGLSEKEKKAVLVMYNLDWIRLCIAKRKYVRALRFAWKSKIPMYVYWDYVKYIFDRKKNRTSYGFVVKIK